VASETKAIVLLLYPLQRRFYLLQFCFNSPLLPDGHLLLLNRIHPCKPADGLVKAYRLLLAGRVL